MKCITCNKRFTPRKATTYTAAITEGAFLDRKTTLYDATDCQRCGRQILLGIRVPEQSPKVLKASWEVAIGVNPENIVKCTNCNLMNHEPTPYCPHCGAVMEETEEE